jgi:hypothetical protein
MHRRSARAGLVLFVAVACTAGPALLPIDRPAAPPEPCGERRIAIDAPAELVAAGPRVLGRAWIPQTDSDRIRWFDPVTLDRTDRSHAALPEQTWTWAVSPDGRRVAIGLRRSVRVIDTTTFRAVARLPEAGGSSILAWLTDETLVSIGDEEVRTWDRSSEEFRRVDLPDAIVAMFVAADRVLLITGRGPASAGSPDTQLVEIGIAGMRTIALDRIVTFDEDRGEIGLHLTPALTYDPIGRRAFVVPPEGPIAEVDLVHGTVRYQRTPASFVRTIATSFLPTAHAKLAEWETVRAVWLGDGLLAVTGETGGTFDLDVSAAGVSIVDTRDWSACLLDPRPTHVATSDGVLVTWGGAEFGEHGGTGLVGYDLDDGDRWHRFGRQYLDLQLYGGYAYAINSWDGWRVRTVDLRTGDIVARSRGRPPTVLPVGSSSAW